MDSKGQTLYRRNRDSMNKSTCWAACAKVWSPLLTTGSGLPVAGSGVTALGTINVSGCKQVIYQGMPLYTFNADSSSGQVKGQNVTDPWGTWFTVARNAPAGDTKTTAPATAPATTGGGGGGPAF